MHFRISDLDHAPVDWQLRGQFLKLGELEDILLPRCVLLQEMYLSMYFLFGCRFAVNWCSKTVACLCGNIRTWDGISSFKLLLLSEDRSAREVGSLGLLICPKCLGACKSYHCFVAVNSVNCLSLLWSVELSKTFFRQMNILGCRM